MIAEGDRPGRWPGSLSAPGEEGPKSRLLSHRSPPGSQSSSAVPKGTGGARSGPSPRWGVLGVRHPLQQAREDLRLPPDLHNWQATAGLKSAVPPVCSRANYTDDILAGECGENRWVVKAGASERAVCWGPGLPLLPAYGARFTRTTEPLEARGPESHPSPALFPVGRAGLEPATYGL
jgi:hypothetical protein